MEDLKKIGIVCNSQFPDLYEESLSFYKHLNIEKIKIDGSNKFYSIEFLYHLIETSEFDWVILIDEDCFITNTNAMMDLLAFQIENNIDFCGCPDGGVIKCRSHNPISINTFFTILNLKKIREVYNKIEIMNTVYENDLEIYTPKHLLKENYGFRYTNYEPYYKLFFWMLNKKMVPLYLDSSDYSIDDPYTNIIQNHKGVEFGYHSWCSRKWNEESSRTRIENLIKDAKLHIIKEN